MMRAITIIIGLVLCFCSSAQENPYVFKEDAKLTYIADENGNIIPDYSCVGYKLGEEAIPDIEVKITLEQSANSEDDRTADIQKAIDQLSAMPMQKNGYRGALLLKAGRYRVDSTLHIHDSGIVIKGEGIEGSGTIIYYSSKVNSDLFDVSGIDDVTGKEATRSKVVDAYVPYGVKTISVQPRHKFKVGDKVLYVDQKTSAWVDTLGMNTLEAIGKKLKRKKTVNWTPESYTLKYKRVVTAVDGNKITLDAPVMEYVDGIHSKAYLEKYEWKGKLENIGFENFKAVSYYASDEDENHGANALAINDVENVWVRNVHAQYFVVGLLTLKNVYKATVTECISSDFKSIITGGRRYGFTISANSERCLITHCISKNGGRHSFATGSRLKGPNVFYNCVALGAVYSDVGPHERWAVGTLWENVKTPGVINIQNRGVLGSGHGWTAAQNTFWNCEAGQRMSVNNPPMSYKNWIMGCSTPELNHKSSGRAGEVSIADVYSQNKKMPFSLFAEQSKASGNRDFNFTEHKPVMRGDGLLKEMEVPDRLWSNKGTLIFEFKLDKEALHDKQLIVDCPVLKLDLKNNSLWPVVKAAPQAKGERKERVQFAFFKPEQWYKLCITWDGSRKKFQLYLNGEKQQPSYFSQWNKNDFSGHLSLGSMAVAVRNVELFETYSEEHIVSLLSSDLDTSKLSGEGKQTFDGALNLRPYVTSLVYEADFSKAQTIVHENELFDDNKRARKPTDAIWVLEGNAKAFLKDENLVIQSSEEGEVEQNHAVLWNTTVFPENFLLEFEMTAKDARDGLGIIFFSSTAHGGDEDVFSLHLPKRDGYFGRYMNGVLDCYHTSYWASNIDKGSRESTNLRKNKGFKLVALGDENIGKSGHENPSLSEKHLVRLLKIDGKIQLETRGQQVLSWQDDGNTLGEVLGKGQIGLRHMGHAKEVTYSKFKVYEITKK